MTTLPPPETKPFPEDSTEKKIYSAVETLAEFMPIPNDRSRLAFSLIRDLAEGGDTIETIVKTQKLALKGISLKELSLKLENELGKIS